MARLLLLLPTTTYRTAAFVQAARRLGIDLTVASEVPSTLEAARPADLLTIDFRTPERAVEQAVAFARRHPLDGVLGVDDDTVVAAAAIAAALDLRGNPPHAALAARDKHEQRQRLRAAGARVPGFSLAAADTDASELARRAPYPCVIKPLRLAASRGVIRANDPGAFVAALDRIRRLLAEPDTAACGAAARSVLIEEFVPGVEVALEGLLVRGRLHVLALFDKPDPLNGPFFEETLYVTPSRLDRARQEAAARGAEHAARALGLVEGPVHAELRLDPGPESEDGAPTLIEIAARPIGGRCSAVLRFGVEGVSLEEVVMSHALGIAPRSLEREPCAAGVMMIPVPGSGVLREVRGQAAARAVSLVEDLVITAHPGERLVPWPEGSRYPGFIFARGATPEGVEQALREAHRRLEFVLE